METVNNIFSKTIESTGMEKLIKYSLGGTKKHGNFYKFLIDEGYNALYVLWLGFSGACIMIMINLVRPTCPDGGNIDDLLPTDSDAAPYCGIKDEVDRLNAFQKIFSHKSDFPYSLRLGTRADVYLTFFTGMLMFLFSFTRSCLKTGCTFLHKNMAWSVFGWSIVDTFSFYILPTALYYIANIGVLPFFAVMGPNLYSTFTQKNSKFAYLIGFAFFANIFMFPKIDDWMFMYNIFIYLMHIGGGYILTFMLIPLFSYFIGAFYGLYMMLFFNFLPLFLVFYGGMTFTEFFTQACKQIAAHWAGLAILFLFFSINIAYKNLDKNIALGFQIGSMFLILSLLNVFGQAKLYTLKAVNSMGKE